MMSDSDKLYLYPHLWLGVCVWGGGGVIGKEST